RVKAKKEAQQAQAETTIDKAPAQNAETEEVDPRKAAVAAAIARAKAKKAQQAAETASTVEAPAQNVEVENVDP
ncbi:hypothetical protein, partial [Proteus terrae]|uniref:hypothetical protein n=1 Tax=Proteus terrae TaxID=1574161 RepID=UPI003314A903